MKIQLLYISLLFTFHTSLISAQVTYPETLKTDHKDTYFNVEISDPYQWLEDDNSEETKDWVSRQNQVTQDYLSQIKYRDQIKDRLMQLNDYTKLYHYKKLGDITIYLKNTGLQDQAVWMYKHKDSEEELVLLDPNELDPEGTTTYSFSAYSDDLNTVVVAVNKAGSDWTTLKVFSLNTMEFEEDELQWTKFSNARWYKDGFYYSKYPTPEEGKELSAASEYQSIYYHQIGTPQSEDILIYKDDSQPQHYHNLTLTHDKAYQILYKRSGTDGFEVLYRKQDENIRDSTPFQYLFKGFKNKNYILGNIDHELIVLTDVDAPNYKIVRINLNQPDQRKWKTLIKESTSVIESASIANEHLVISYLKNAHSEIETYNLKGKKKQLIPLPGLGSATITYTKESDKELYFSYSSFTTPLTNFSYNIETQKIQELSNTQPNFNPDDYISKQVWYTSKDGTLIPMFLIHKKGLKKNGNQPTYLYAYGGFNVNITPSFSTSYISLLEQGVVIAIPNLRGGGEFGEEWHQAGMLFNKQNVFDDFIAAAEYLIHKKYTSPEKLAIAGGSNGGLLVGACMTQRPELFRVAFPAVGVMDMLKYQNFTVGWGWVPEYGSSDQSKEMFEYLYSYSPYHNIKKNVNYPATMVTTADHDDRVVPAHSFKFAARLQEYTKNKYPALIRIDIQAGHGAGKPISKIIDEVADKWSFFLWNVGVENLKISNQNY